jgi:hypothetical protein
MGDYSGLIHYPPPYNPDYERENDDALSEWELELRLEQINREAEGLDYRAWDLYNLGVADLADVYVDLAQAAEKRYVEVKSQLVELQSGW